MTETLQNKALIELPRQTFVGPDRDSDYAIAVATRYLEAPPQTLPFSPESLKTNEELQILSEMNSAILEYAEDLGVDITSRLIDPKNVLLYDDAEFERLRVAVGKGEGWGGGYQKPTVAARHASIKDRQEISALSHELIHSVAFSNIRVSHKDSELIAYVDERRTGYTTTKELAFNMLNEGIVEMMSREVAGKYWSKYPLLSQTTHDRSAYVEDMPVIIAMIDKMAEKLDTPREIVWRSLAKGELTGDMKVLRQFVDAFGYKGMREVAGYKEFGAESAGRVALQLGLDIKAPGRTTSS